HDELPRPAHVNVGLHEFLTAAQQAAVTDAVIEINAGREAIHYVCGILMLVYRIGPDDAFEVLRWRSQESNVKLRKLADQLLTDIRELAYDDCVPPRKTFDHLLMTVHERVSSD
ncbi:MAG TPA: ANTAR domain-containing protein, partial [Mycobacterium sp.]